MSNARMKDRKRNGRMKKKNIHAHTHTLGIKSQKEKCDTMLFGMFPIHIGVFAKMAHIQWNNIVEM